MHTAANGPVAVLVKRFPKLSETFIAGEIDELTRQGVDLRIFSIYRPNEPVAHDYPPRLLSRVTYFDEATAQERTATASDDGFRRHAESARFATEPNPDTPTRDDLQRLLTLSRRHNVRHIHAHYLTLPAALAAHVRAVDGTPFSISAHAKDIYLTDERCLRRRLGAAEFLATCTEHNATHLKQLAPTDAHKILRIYHGIDTVYFSPAGATDRAEQAPQLLSIGRFRRKKGFDLLIAMCADLQRTGQTFHTRIVGYGEEGGRLEALIRCQGLTANVELCGPVDRDGVRRLMRQADVFVMPCRISDDGDRDGIPNTLLEAMSCGLPVVSTRVSGIPEVVTSDGNGLLVAPDDVHALAAATRRVLGDTDLRTRLGSAARRTVLNRFDWRVNVSVLAQRLGAPHVRN